MNTTWSRVCASAVAGEARDHALAPLRVPPPSAEVPARVSQQLALDGKRMRGTIPRGQNQGVHLLSAYDVAAGVGVAHVPVLRKENEIVAAPRLLTGLNLRGSIISGDAMVAQRGLSTQVVEPGGDYCGIAKENQPTLFDDLKLRFSPIEIPVAKGGSPIPLDVVPVEQCDKGHGWREYRRRTTRSLRAGYRDWPYLAQAFQVVRVVSAGRDFSCAERYGITSAPAGVATPRRRLAVVRGHGQIENGLHHRRDVTVQEAASQVRMGQAPHVLACLNNAVCGLAARAGQTNLAALPRALAAAIDRLLFRN